MSSFEFHAFLPASPTDQPATHQFAFLVHSQDTIPRNLPPNVDNKPLARQRRRRTSPEDQAVLEAEYQRDPRPDKTARRRIVQRVALGEKEVQIWFQNRRQCSRRKSRPLQPHEILPHLKSTDFPSIENNPEPTQARLIESSAEECANLGDSFSSPQSLDASSARVQATEYHDAGTASAPESPRDVKKASRRLARSAPSTPANIDMREPALCPSSCSFASGNDSGSTDLGPVNHSEESQASLGTSRSRIRLSTTSDGSARIITSDSPSPPRLEISEMGLDATSRSLRRSYSVSGIGDGEDLFGPSKLRPRVPRMPNGRSRDSRAWEFWCDSDSRNELVKKAEQEQNGSAEDAISRIRSNNRGPLTPRGDISKHTFANTSTERQRLRRNMHSSKIGLPRAMSSIGRLQTKPVNDFMLYDDAKRGFAAGNTPQARFSPTGDSDKENWEPGTKDVPRRSFANGSPKRHTGPRVLRETYSVPSQSANMARALHGAKAISRLGGPRVNNRKDQENLNPEDDEEIANFMRMGKEGSLRSDAAAEDDMDCIQGLLSLSQGNWS